MIVSLVRTGGALGASVLGLAAIAACAAGSDGTSSTSASSGQGGVAWSSSSTTAQGGGETSGTGGAEVGPMASSGSSATSNSASGSGGAGAGGGASSVNASSSASSSVAASAASSGAGGGGGGPSGRALLLATSTAMVVGGAFDGTTWTKSTLAGGSNRPPALGIVGSTLAVGAWRDASNGKLTYVKHDGALWGAPMAVGPDVTTQGAPALTVRGTAVDVVFHGDDFKHYFASYTGAWLPKAEAVMPNGQSQSFGPAAGAVAAVGQETVLAFAGDNGVLFEQSRVAGAWQGAKAHAATSTQRTPALVALSKGAELLVVYSNSTDKKLMFATRKAGAWQVPAVVEATIFTDETPTLAALADGAAQLVFRGTDGKPYTSRYTPANNPPWSAPKPLAVNNPSVASTPSIAPGFDGTDAELAYVSADGKAFHTRLTGTVWSTPVEVAGPNLQHVVLVTAP